ncbi:unnamed protein product [Parnassius apollo]|uniref:(apollo) hypothetical protein n=1 Tax=Parnassius apollo TaxID=110799 RepID=A0A8S3YBF4_PARAO|nr:unnamed protein product [Parnassius apollo]
MEYFFSDEKLEEIVRNTNTEIGKQREKYKRDRPVQNTEDENADASSSTKIRPSFAKDASVGNEGFIWTLLLSRGTQHESRHHQGIV